MLRFFAITFIGLLLIQTRVCLGQICYEFIVNAETLKNAGNYQGAIIEYNKAIKLEPTNPEYFLKRGKIYAKIRNDALAIEDFNTVIRLRPNKYEALFLRAYIYALTQNSRKALFQYNKWHNKCSDEQNELFQSKILTNVENNEFQKLTQQYTEYFLLFLKGL
jgi:tetratricopeptide (TPR) repeat protein